MIRLFIASAIARAASLEEIVLFMCVSKDKWLSIGPREIAKQEPCQASAHGKTRFQKAICVTREC